MAVVMADWLKASDDRTLPHQRFNGRHGQHQIARRCRHPETEIADLAAAEYPAQQRLDDRQW